MYSEGSYGASAGDVLLGTLARIGRSVRVFPVRLGARNSSGSGRLTVLPESGADHCRAEPGRGPHGTISSDTRDTLENMLGNLQCVL